MHNTTADWLYARRDVHFTLQDSLNMLGPC